ncbi:MAG: magnesium/cobalt transporter CorA [Candidatus Thorarchaeota archaeon]|jgi:magnesium transporter
MNPSDSSKANEIKKKAGLPPGTPVHTGKKRLEPVEIHIMDYSESNIREYTAESPEECIPPKDKKSVRWIHVAGVHEPSIIEEIGNNFGIHPLTIEDILHIEQRPKFEIVGNGIYVVLRAFTMKDDEELLLTSEQISIILGEGYVLSFQETLVDHFHDIRKRLLQSIGRIRSCGPDYLAYSLLDITVDNYFVLLELLETKIEALEDDLIARSTRKMLEKIYSLKRVVQDLRRHMWPLRDAFSLLQRDPVSLFEDSTKIYLRDLYDHSIRVANHVDTHRESLTAMLEIYLSTMSNRMNEVMQLLAVISTIFIPLTLMASIYGMNFIYMPETEWVFGYPVLLLTMSFIAILMGLYFHRKGWL